MFAALMRVPRYAKTRSEAETKARKTGLRSRHDQRGEQGMLETSGMLALAGLASFVATGQPCQHRWTPQDGASG